MGFHTSLATKYRPSTFEEVVGQRAAVEVIKAAAARRHPKVFLFTGQHGIGKTTLARIFARALNCDASPSVCGKCKSCRAFSSHAHPDIIEQDMGSKGLVADARRLVQEAAVVPTWKARVFILDEVHSASNEAFDALLRLLEEPPATCYIIMCTTSPEKVPFTVISRSLRLDFVPLSVEDTFKRLCEVAKLEGYDRYDASVMKAIARHAGGSMRDALMVLERLFLRAGDSPIGVEMLEAEPWFISKVKVKRVLRCMLSQDYPGFEQEIRGLSSLQALSMLRDILDLVCSQYLSAERKADRFVDVLWTSYLRACKGAEPLLVFKGLWLDLLSLRRKE